MDNTTKLGIGVMIILLAVFFLFYYNGEGVGSKEVQAGCKKVEYKYVENASALIWPWVYENFTGVIIKNESQYEGLVPRIRRYLNVSAPSIDFSKYVLLGYYTYAKGCKVKFLRSVCKDEREKKIIYKIVGEREGDCNMYFRSMNYVLVPRIEDDYEVEFKYEEVNKSI